MKTIRKPDAAGKGIPRPLLRWAAMAAIPLAAVIVYLPAVNGGWIWDDDTSVYRNPMVTDSQNGLYKAWSTTSYDYWPMTTTAFWIEYQLFNDPGKPADQDSAARNYHIVNVLLHALAAFLVFLVLKRLAIPGALLAGLVFAVHPINAVSVVWVSELKNLLSMIFLAMTLLAYLRFERSDRRLWYALALAAFALALASKTSVVMLPVGLLGLAWWQRGRIARRDILRSVGFFLLSAGMAGMTLFAQGRQLDVTTKPLDGIYRLAGAGWVVCFYIYKALVPVKLSMIYPHWKETIESAGWISFLPTAALVGVFTVLLLKRNARWARPILLALGYFVLAAFPVLGFFGMTFMMHSLVADHFQYLPIVGVISLVCAAFWKLAQRCGPRFRVIFVTAAAVVIVFLGAQSFRRANVIKAKDSLWRNTIKVNDKAWMAHFNLGNVISKPTNAIFKRRDDLDRQSMELASRAKALRAGGDRKQADAFDRSAREYKELADAELRKGRSILIQAVPHYRKAIAIEPMYPPSYNNLGSTLLRLGRTGEAIEQFRKGIEMNRLSPARKRTPLLQDNLGNALLRENRLEEAAEAFKQSFLTQPTYGDALTHALTTYRRMGRYDECVELMSVYLEKNPKDAGAQQSISVFLLNTGRTGKAMEHVKRSIDLDPTNPVPYMTQGDILIAAKKPAEAIESFDKAVQVNRRRRLLQEDDLRVKLATAQFLAGRNAEAMLNLALILRGNPNHRPARAAIGEVMKRMGHTAEAAKSYEQAIKIIPGWLDAWQKLAWIRATHPDTGVRNARQALDLARKLISRQGKGNPVVMDTLAAALAESRQFPEATSAAREALKIARDENNERLAREIQGRLDLYEKGLPYRESP